MRVLLQNRADLYDKPGGDLVQMEQTKQALEQLGVEVEISISTTPQLADIDLVHLYNITRIHETYAQLKWAKAHHKPVVVSPIYHRNAEIERYEQFGRTGRLRQVNQVFRSTAQREYLKSMVRMKDSRQRAAIWQMWRQGFWQAQRSVLERADAWIVLAHSEAQALQQDYQVQGEYIVARNAIDPAFAEATAEEFVARFHMRDFVLCVGRIEDRKNQLRLIEAMNEMGRDLVFIGGRNHHHQDYLKQFDQAVASRSWVHYLGALPYQQLPSAYAAAAVHVLPSWYEVVSLTALEAGMAGCREVVADTGYMREYLQDQVDYCDPGDVKSIRSALDAALAKPITSDLRTALHQLTWEQTARDTLHAYEQVLSTKP